jgi:hypothetical protein
MSISITKILKPALAAVVGVTAVLIMIAAFQPPQSTVSEAKGNQEDAKNAKRRWKWLVPPPPFVKLLNVKNLDGDSWMTDVELKFKNKSDRPLYFLEFVIYAPNMKIQDAVAAIHVRFGDSDLWDKRTPTEDDPFIAAGEEFVLTVSENRKELFRKIFQNALPQKGDRAESMSLVEFYNYHTVFDRDAKYVNDQLISGEGVRQISSPRPQGIQTVPGLLIQGATGTYICSVNEWNPCGGELQNR